MPRPRVLARLIYTDKAPPQVALPFRAIERRGDVAGFQQRMVREVASQVALAERVSATSEGVSLRGPLAFSPWRG